MVTSPPGYLDEGLFGRVILWILEILPYLQRRGIYPQWRIPSSLYGVGANKLAIPGILDLAYEPPERITREISLVDLRNRHCSHLGSDWTAIQRLWNAYFRIPERVYTSADAFSIPENTLGVHFRGTDKVTSAWDSNFFSKQDMVTLVEDYLRAYPGIRTIFVATDEAKFINLLRENVGCEVISLGGAKHHKDTKQSVRSDYADADRALLDCVLLSRCDSVLLTSSALSAFAKILNPTLPIYRCVASKAMWYGPYFPVAYIPIYEPQSHAGKRILHRALEGDWRKLPWARRFSQQFASKPNWPWRLKAAKRAIKRRVYALQRRPPPYAGDYFIK